MGRMTSHAFFRGAREGKRKILTECCCIRLNRLTKKNKNPSQWTPVALTELSTLAVYTGRHSQRSLQSVEICGATFPSTVHRTSVPCPMFCHKHQVKQVRFLFFTAGLFRVLKFYSGIVNYQEGIPNPPTTVLSCFLGNFLQPSRIGKDQNRTENCLPDGRFFSVSTVCFQERWRAQ